jgi:hypothetical protein
MITLLKKYGADSNYRTNETCPSALLLAIGGLNDTSNELRRELIRCLLPETDLTLQDSYGECPLHYAARFCDEQTYRLFQTAPSFGAANRMKNWNGETPESIRKDGAYDRYRIIPEVPR